MTNKHILKKYFGSLLSRIKNDKPLHRYFSGRAKEMMRKIPSRVRDLGEAPGVDWKHNVNPSGIRKMVREANKRKTDAKWTANTLAKAFGG